MCTLRRGVTMSHRQVMAEDKAMIEKLVPEQIVKEYSVLADMPQIRYRKLRAKYLERGYGVLPEDLEANKWQIAMACNKPPEAVVEAEDYVERKATTERSRGG